MKSAKAVVLTGLLVCIVSSSNVWGGELFPINPGFECCPVYSNGAPTGYGYWSYDLTQVVTAENGITPKEGSHMLRFIGTLPSGPACPSHASETYQLFDVSPIADCIVTGETFVWVEYQVNRVAGDSQTDTEFSIRISAHSGSPSSFPTYIYQALAEAQNSIVTDSDPATWEKVGVSLSGIPANTTYLAIGIWANENVYDDCSDPEFDGHYGDEIKLHYGCRMGTEETSWGAIKSLF
jgi:hypothetical protein